MTFEVSMLWFLDKPVSSHAINCQFANSYRAGVAACKRIFMSKYRTKEVLRVSLEHGAVSLVCELPGPRGAAVDRDGNLYVADQNLHQVLFWRSPAHARLEEVDGLGAWREGENSDDAMSRVLTQLQWAVGAILSGMCIAAYALQRSEAGAPTVQVLEMKSMMAAEKSRHIEVAREVQALQGDILLLEQGSAHVEELTRNFRSQFMRGRLESVESVESDCFADSILSSSSIPAQLSARSFEPTAEAGLALISQLQTELATLKDELELVTPRRESIG